MYTMHPTVLVGPADWDPAQMPQEEFVARIGAFFAACDPAITGAVVYGDPRSHAELAYFTHATPKLEACLALIPRVGAPRLLVGGGANMVGAAKPLTWIEALAPLREAGATIARWRDEVNGALALVNGDAMPLRLRKGIETALGGPPADATGVAAEAMRRKSPRELALVREACMSLRAMFAAMSDAQAAGRGMTDTVLVGERAAWRRGAQDVRSLFGRDWRLTPFCMRDDAPADPLQVYLAVRHDGYWAEGLAVLSRASPPLAAAARAMLADAIDRIGPGTPRRDVARRLAHAIGDDRVHAVTRRDFGHRIGLALQEAAPLNEASTDAFAAGEVHTLRAGLRDGNAWAVVSAMIAITDSGREVLWRECEA